jgi:putative CocE/NonD family hydrolase
MFRSLLFRQACVLGLLLVAAVPAPATQPDVKNLPAYIRENYTRQDHEIAMRDGVKLYTVVYAPKDKTQKYPIIMTRTPYSVAPYAKDSMRGSLGPNKYFAPEGYIFVYQDVRGCYMSEGSFVNMRPHQAKHKDKSDIDESTDTYDTIDWLVKNIEGNNGKVGLYGISYPGFYSSAGMINAHPALKAVSPQAPIADWFFDDFFHHGAFFLPHAFNFFSSFGQPRPKPTTSRPGRGFGFGTNDGYQFFLDIGPLTNANKKYLKNHVAFWNEMMDHPNYDAFWQARNLLPHLKKCAPAVMTVGGWFDAEDLYGALNTYAAVEKQNPGIFNVIVMGPWDHGGWAGFSGSRLGNIGFGSDTSPFFQKQMELPFFNHFLKGKGEHQLPEAYMFETGANKWRQFDQWPPKGVDAKKLYFHAGGKLAFEPVADKGNLFDEYISDPHRPVPFTEAISTGMTREYMTDDQRFGSKRPDVAVYQTDVLTDDLTLAGKIVADLKVSTSGTDSDWIVKVIDVFPQTASDPASSKPLAGYQMMVRSEVIRGRFRNSYEKPEPFKADEPTTVRLTLQDVLHTFKKGHRVMVQVCSTWFPLVDRNPQKYVDNIFYAQEKDFIRTNQRVYCSQTYPTALEIGILQPSKN